MRLLTLVFLASIAATQGFGGESIPAQTLEELKEATVFIKVGGGSGSGFLIRKEDKTGFIVTNNHVVHRRTLDGATSSAGWTNVVFHSGTKREISVKGDVLAYDPEQDLALLKVTSGSELPRPVDLSQQVELRETTQVYGLGFPFGKSLATGRVNPSISVTRCAVSSVRKNDQDELVKVQIDGALNPGNSGGPIVDSKGRLVGVVSSGIQGSGIAFAVPSLELVRMLEGRLGKATLAVKKKSGTDIQLALGVHLVDPFDKIKSVALHYHPATGFTGNRARLDSAPATKKLELTIDKQKAAGTFSITPVGKGIDQQRLLWQISYVRTDGKEIVGKSQTFDPNTIKDALAAQETADGEPPLPKMATAVGRVGPGSFDQAIEWLRAGQPHNLIACNSLAKAEVFRPRQKDIAAELAKLFAGKDGLAALQAGQALVVWATEEQVPSVLKVLEQNDHYFMSKYAVEILARLQDPRAIAPLAKRLAGAKFSERKPLGDALIKFGPQAEEEVRKHLDHKDKGVREEAARILRSIGKENTADEFKTALASLKEDQQPHMLLKTLDWFATTKPVSAHRSEVVQELMRIMKDRNPFVMLIMPKAAKAMDNWASKEEAPFLIEILKEHGPEPIIIKTLGRLKDEKAIPVLAEMLASPFNAQDAITALTSFGPAAEKEAVKYLNRERRATKLASCKLLCAIGTMHSVPALEAARTQARREMQQGYEEVADAITSAIEALKAR